MVKLYNPNCKLASVYITDKELYESISTHFLTYVSKNPISTSCFVNQVTIRSRLTSMEEYVGKWTIQKQEQKKALNQLYVMADKGPIYLTLVSQDVFDQMEPIG